MESNRNVMGLLAIDNVWFRSLTARKDSDERIRKQDTAKEAL